MQADVLKLGHVCVASCRSERGFRRAHRGIRGDVQAAGSDVKS